MSSFGVWMEREQLMASLQVITRQECEGFVRLNDGRSVGVTALRYALTSRTFVDTALSLGLDTCFGSYLIQDTTVYLAARTAARMVFIAFPHLREYAPIDEVAELIGTEIETWFEKGAQPC